MRRDCSNACATAPYGFSRACQLSQAVVMLSPVTHFCDHYRFYPESPATDLIRAMPVVWDETRVLDCTSPGDTVAIARRKGDVWWVGVMNGEKEREVTLDFGFLRRDAAASLLKDVPGKPDAFERTERIVRRGEKTTLKLAPLGGFFARLVERPE